MKFSPQLENHMEQLQKVEEQLQVLLTQKYQMEAQLKDIERTLEYLEKVPDDRDIYRNIGALLIKAEGKEKVMGELREKKETYELRLKSFDRQEKSLKDSYDALKKSITDALQMQQ